MNKLYAILFILVSALNINSVHANNIATFPQLPVDDITLKQREMRNPVISVRTQYGGGSGIIIRRLKTDSEGIFEYAVLTNAHVIHKRFVTFLRRVNSITGKLEIETVDTGCKIIVFNYEDNNSQQLDAEVIAEDVSFDLAILSFQSDKEYPVVLMANDEMLQQIRVFDTVFAIGCQLGHSPSPTVGIISKVFTRFNNGQARTIYSHTAQLSPGSSGGGLFKKYGNHYYLIGIPYRVEVAKNGQYICHLAYAISFATARDFLCEHSVLSCE